MTDLKKVNELLLGSGLQIAFPPDGRELTGTEKAAVIRELASRWYESDVVHLSDIWKRENTGLT